MTRNSRATSIPRPYESDTENLNNSKKTLDKLIKDAEEKVRNIPAKKNTYGILKKPALKKTTTTSTTPVPKKPAQKLSKLTTTQKSTLTPRGNPIISTSQNNLASSSRTNLSHNETGTVKRNYTPLNPPSSHLNNSGYNYDNLINPLPSIRSPYYSARDTNYYPDLNEWGVTQPVNYDDNRYTTFARGSSPFLPTYNLAKKAQKGYLIIPKSSQQYSNLSDVADRRENNPNRLDYISSIPYTNPIVSNQVSL